MNENPYTLTVADACKAAGGITRTTLYRWMAQGLFPKPKQINPRRLRWCQADFDAWQAARGISNGA